jgi:hypothetical protein
MSVVHPASRFAPILENPVLLWIGQRSYAIYLWHWIIFQVTRPTVDLAGQTWALYSLRILIVFALADISLRYVEIPIRRGALKYWLKGLKYRTKKERSRQTRFFISIFVLVLALSSVVSVRAISIGNEQRVAIEESLNSSEVSAPNPSAEGIWLTGDSVILGIRTSLNEVTPVSLINARIGRQAPELLDVMKRDIAQAGESPVIFNLGNNGLLQEEVVREIFELVKSQSSIIVVNTAVPRPWRDSNNSLVKQIASQYSNVRVIDWNSISAGRPEYFAPDGVHLVPAGVEAYVSEIKKYL